MEMNSDRYEQYLLMYSDRYISQISGNIPKNRLIDYRMNILCRHSSIHEISADIFEIFNLGRETHELEASLE